MHVYETHSGSSTEYHKVYNPHGVDLIFATNAFTGTDTINVTANIVGNNGMGLDDTYGIAAGAPGHGSVSAIGFQTWNVYSEGVGVSSENNIALGADGAQTATTLKVTDDGSTTIIYATNISGSNGAADWANLTTIDASGTTGQLTITGGETHSNPMGAGLLADNTTMLSTVIGGSGPDVFDLSSSTWAATAGSKYTGEIIDQVSINGGGNTTGTNSLYDSNDVVPGQGLGTVVELSGAEVNTITAAYPGLTGAFAEWTGVPTLYIVLPYGEVSTGAEESGVYAANTPPPPLDLNINWADFPGTGTITLANSHSGNWLTVGDVTITNAPTDGMFNFQDVQSAGDFSITGIGGVGDTDTITYGTGYLSTDPVYDSSFTSLNIDNLNVYVYGASDLTTNQTSVYNGGIVDVGNSGNEAGSGGGTILTIHSNVGLDLADNGHNETLSVDTLTLFGGTETITTLPSFTVTWSDTGTVNLDGTAEYWLGVTNASTINDNVSTEPLIMNAPGDAIDYGIGGVTVTADGKDSQLQGNLDIVHFGSGSYGGSGGSGGSGYDGGVNFTSTGDDTLTDTAGHTTFYGAGGTDTINLGGGTNNVVFGEYSLNGSTHILLVTEGTGTDPGFWDAAQNDLGGSHGPDTGNGTGTFDNSTSNDTTTIYNFDLGSDVLTFNVSAWAGSHLVDAASASNAAITDSSNLTATQYLGTPGIALGTTSSGHVDLILDAIQTFSSASQLAAAIGTLGVGDFILGAVPPSKGEDMLVAYSNGTDITIADVHVTGSYADTGKDTVTAYDMVHLVGITSLANLATNTVIDFAHVTAA